ncbi:metal ABC transporter ATP-binding protein [Paracoccus sp. (in: a-proteobacteria)]|uniref:metal ABC transporter ATP-binding protein n=1 Tax=Paracoccus sp. TaxID=267 RepID=UPI0026DFFE1C|nr:metal ABC transporter ATP-binding protein [Paracoccus sp. (in: a-proteobacteria)]MDO5648004.1 metal ABC transporter ATP-binding protein [Paracoccus sp. (in: a-proteobacteria)]
MTAPALSIRGVTVSYGDHPVAIDVSADIAPGTMTAIIGPNGAGKSSLLRGCLGLLPRVAGDVQVWGRPVDQARDDIAYVPQRASVDWDFPATARDVVQMGMYRRVGLLGRFSASLTGRARDCLDRVGMADFANRQIGQLSGGQQQRVFLARALAQDARLYVLDEPFAGVDAATERAIIKVLKSLAESGFAVIAVHHDLATLRDYFDTALLMNMRLIASGPVDLVATPDNLTVAYGGRHPGAAP